MLSMVFSLLVSVLLKNNWKEFLFFLGLMSGFAMNSQSELFVMKVSSFGEIDALGFVLIVLSVWVISMSLMSSSAIKNSLSDHKSFFILSCLLLMSLVSGFLVSDFMFFYIMFECSLIPIFIMVMGWGYQPERSKAAIYLMMYTLLGSFPLLSLIIWLFKTEGNLYMFSSFSGYGSFIFVLFLSSAFLVKFPMYGVHLWLLKAHVEAPVAGSMILAGVLLKLGGYGLIRFFIFMKGEPNWLVEVVLVLSLWGGAVVSLSCMRQVDMKLLIASSSVVHMSTCIGGLFILNEWGLKGSVMMMIAHGLCSSGLFYLANFIYERVNSRNLLVCKGMLNLLPSVCLWWFLFSAANMAAPPSLNLISEISLIIGLISWDLALLVSISIMSFFSAAYSLYLFSMSQHGLFLSSKSSMMSGFNLNYLICAIHFIPINMLVLSLFLFIY